MENKTVLIVVALVLAYLLFLRKPQIGGAVRGGLPAGAVPKPITPKPATPNVSTGGAIAAAAIAAAPSILSSLGSFFSNDDSSSDYSDSAAFSDDEFVGDYY